MVVIVRRTAALLLVLAGCASPSGRTRLPTAPTLELPPPLSLAPPLTAAERAELPALEAALASADPDLRAAAEDRLRRLGPGAVRALHARRESLSPQACSSLEKVLARMLPPSEEEIVHYRRHRKPTRWARESGGAALKIEEPGSFKGPSVRYTLIDAAGTERWSLRGGQAFLADGAVLYDDRAAIAHYDIASAAWSWRAPYFPRTANPFGFGMPTLVHIGDDAVTIYRRLQLEGEEPDAPPERLYAVERFRLRDGQLLFRVLEPVPESEPRWRVDPVRPRPQDRNPF